MTPGLVLALALAAEAPVLEEALPGHPGQIEVHLNAGQPIELDAPGRSNTGRGLIGVGGGYWLGPRVELGLELRAGVLVPPGLRPVGVDWGQVLVAKGLTLGEGGLLSAGLLFGFYSNSFSIFPDAGLRLRALYELEHHFDVGLAVTPEVALAQVHNPLFVSVEGTIGFAFR
jgi:hypothetical protein